MTTTTTPTPVLLFLNAWSGIRHQRRQARRHRRREAVDRESVREGKRAVREAPRAQGRETDHVR